MRIRLLKSMTTPHAKYSIGTIINYSDGLALKLIEKKEAEKYTGPYPPKLDRKNKMRFKLSNLNDHGNN